MLAVILARRIGLLVGPRGSLARRAGHSEETSMRIHRVAVAVALASMSINASLAHEVEEGKGTLGKVSFANSCDAKVQAEFQRAVAMLHLSLIHI